MWKCRYKTLKWSKIFIEYSQHNNINHYNANWKIKILIEFHDMISDTMTNKKFQTIIK